MSTVEGIITAAARLDPAEFLRLREELDRIEQQLWQAEQARAATEPSPSRASDDEIDRLVVWRREGR